VAATTLALAASVSATGDTVTKVVFNATWGSTTKVACSAAAPQADGRWSCKADLVRLGAPAGPVSISYDVVTAASGTIASPSGSQTATYVPTPSALWKWRTVASKALYAEQVIPASAASVAGINGIWSTAGWYCVDDVTVGSIPFGGMVVTTLNTRTGKTATSRASARVNIPAGAVTLPDGRILVVGTAHKQVVGDQTSTETNLAAAEVYSPKTNRWSVINSPAAPGSQGVVLLDANHVALLGGAVDLDKRLTTVQVLTISTGQYRTVGQLPGPAAPSVAAKLADGRLLVVDGLAYVVDPATWKSTTLKSPAAGVFWKAAWPTPDGRTVVAGISTTDAGKDTLVTSVINAGETKWGSVTRVPLAWNAAAVGHDASGRALVIGGSKTVGDGCNSKYTTRSLAVDALTGDVAKLPALPVGMEAAWIVTLPDGRIVVGPAGGPTKAGTLVLAP
jgi:hypothetical protein